MVRTTASWTGSFSHVSRLTGASAQSRVWVPGPLTASMNLFAAVHARLTGASLVAKPHTMTHAHLTPVRLRRCLDDRVPLAGATVVVAGDRLSPALAEEAESAGARVCHYYGAAELSFVAWGRHAEDLQPFPEVEVVARDGELWVRSPWVCLGYDGPPGPLRRDGDGYATVGDRGRLVDGRVLVTGRPGAVTTGGATVVAADVEAVLREAARGEVVVVGLPHGVLGEVVAAVLTDARDHGPLREAAAALPSVARPRVWFHVRRLPLTTAGKVDRLALAGVAAAPGAVRLV